MTPTLVAMYTYPGENQYDLWYICPKRSCKVYYIKFLNGWKGEGEVSQALRAATEKNTCGIEVTRQHPEASEHLETESSPTFDSLTFSVCQFKPYRPHFNSDFVAVNHDEVIHLKRLKDNVSVVSLRGETYVYKFMNPKYQQLGQQISF